jgi:serine/threonine protein kinase/tetratricopeptide (TPR) repeat protein
MSAHLGPFHLLDVLGSGAMGVVYEAIHAEMGVPAAVKVDTSPADEKSRAAFLHEVQITAALDHPNVVLLLDHGEVDRAASEATGGAIVPGARWLAMELASGGTAAQYPPGSWSEVRLLLDGVLSGLAHAHARGVVHRDIKLQNLLLAGSDATVSTAPKTYEDARIVLSDFGISDQHDTEALRYRNPVGTPEFMAPELAEGRWRDQGPWTDLYAVGVLIWLLTTNRFPFAGSTPHETLMMHLDDDLPAYEPDMQVPPGTEQLVRWLLMKNPGDRPEFAAEVTRALEGLGQVEALARRPTVVDSDQATVAVRNTRSLRTSRRLAYAGRSQRTLANVPILNRGRSKDNRVSGAGVGLFGLRTVRFVGREVECDALWNALVGVRADSRARCVLISGPAGIGKSRLARWVTERTHELGVATTLRARHRPRAPLGQGLVDMLRRELKTQGLSAEGVLTRIVARFPHVRFDRRALAAVLEPSLFRRPPASEAELRQLVLDVIDAIAETRPVVVVLDDVHHDPAALELMHALLDRQEITPRPVLVLATVRAEELVDSIRVEDLERRLADRREVTRLPVGPLDREGRRRLIRSLIGLEGGVAGKIEDRTAGNPLFAMQLIGAWVEQGVLQPSAEGFRMAPGVEAALPEDVTSVWRSRLNDALQQTSPEAVEALEVASACGDVVDEARLQGACAILGVHTFPGLFDRLRKRHLIHLEDPAGARWRFVHGAVRELLEGRSRQQGRWKNHNLGIAVWLTENAPDVPAIVRARHFLEAEVFEEAIDPLKEAINDQIDEGDLRDPERVGAMRDALVRLGRSEADADWIELDLLESIRARARGEVDQAEDLATSALERATGVPALEAKARRELSRVDFANGIYDDAIEQAEKARQLFEQLGDRVRAADCATVEGNAYAATGDLDNAEAAFVHAVQVFDDDAPERISTPLIGLVKINQNRGDTERTKAWLQELRERAEDMGLQLAFAICANFEGEIARAEGDTEAAARHYHEAADRYRALESPDFAFPLLNLGILDASAGRYEEAVQRMKPILQYLSRRPHPTFFAFVQLVLMVAHAGCGDQPRAVASLRVVNAHVEDTGFVDPDVAQMAEHTARLMREQGWSAAEDALELAIAQYDAAGRTADAERLRAEHARP